MVKNPNNRSKSGVNYVGLSVGQMNALSTSHSDRITVWATLES